MGIIYNSKKVRKAQTGIVTKSIATRAPFRVVPRVLTEEEREAARINDYVQSRPTEEITVPTKQPLGQRAVEAVASPWTSARELYNTGRISPYMDQRIAAGVTDRSNFDATTDMINPVAWANYARKIPGMVSEGQYGAAGMEAAAMIPFFRPGKGAKGILRGMRDAGRQGNARNILRKTHPREISAADNIKELNEIVKSPNVARSTDLVDYAGRPIKGKNNIRKAAEDLEYTDSPDMNRMPKRSQKEILRTDPAYRDAVKQYKDDFATYKAHTDRRAMLGQRQNREIELANFEGGNQIKKKFDIVNNYIPRFNNARGHRMNAELKMTTSREHLRDLMGLPKQRPGADQVKFMHSQSSSRSPYDNPYLESPF